MDTDLHLWFFIFYNKEYIFDVLGGQGWSRTTVLGFSVRHTDRVCHLPIYKTQKEKIVGFEPTTFCLTDKCSTNELNFFLKEKIAVCVFNYRIQIPKRCGCGGLDSNQRPSGYEPDELPTAPPRVVAEAGFEPAISNLWG